MQSKRECDITLMRFGARTDGGKVREANEDAFLALPPWFAVADGMGGHVAGEVASQMAIDEIRKIAEAEPEECEIKKILQNTMISANQIIWQKGQKDSNLTGMGTTLTVAVIVGVNCVLAHVGDSRCYLWQKSGLQLLTKDHSVVGELIRTGTLSENEANLHPQRNVLTRALGSNPSVEVDIIDMNVQSKSRLLLCSDGLTSVVKPEDIELVLSKVKDPKKAVDELIDKANKKGGPDNITVVLVDIP